MACIGMCHPHQPYRLLIDGEIPQVEVAAYCAVVADLIMHDAIPMQAITVQAITI